MRYLYILIITLSFNITLTQAQSSLYSIEFTKPVSTIPNIAFFKVGNEIKLENFENWLKKTYHLSKGLSFRLLSEEHDDLGMIHYRYRQTYKGLDLEVTMLIIHTKDGWVTGFNGIAFNNFNLSTTPTINETQAREEAIKWFGTEPIAEEFIYQLPAQKIKDSLWKGFLIIAPAEEKFEQPYYKLTWRFDFYSPEGPRREHIYVDANGGGVILNLALLHSSDSVCKAKTAFRGLRDITTFYDSSTNLFNSFEKGQYMEMEDGSHGSAYFTNSSNYWAPQNIDSFANDCYWGIERTESLYKNWFHRTGLNGKGYRYLGIPHAFSYANAFWGGSSATFGDGDTQYVYPMTSLDIVGHEFTHGVTQFSSGLIYSHEPGALNEGMSDIFGKTVEWYADSASGKFTWKFAKDAFSKNGGYWRDMQDPLSVGLPCYYKGRNWFTYYSDYGGVHENSNVFNYLYYLIVDGDTGTNEKGVRYKVDSLGFYKASHIFYRLQTVYLNAGSDYPDMANCIILAAIDLYGNCGIEVKAVREALKAIGLNPVTYIPPATSNVKQIQTSAFAGSSDLQVIKVLVMGDCNSSISDSLQSIYLNTNGTSSLSSFSNIKIYYTADTNKFNTTSLVYKQSLITAKIKISKNILLKKTYNYFWITVDAKSASPMDIFDVGVDSIEMNQTWQIPENNNPPEYIVILKCKPVVSENNDFCSSPIVSKLQFAGITLLDSSCTAYDSNYRFIDPGFFIKPGQQYSLYIRVYYNQLYANISHGDTAYTRVWIDYNHNGSFESSESVLYGSTVFSSLDTMITMPSKMNYSRTMMRIISSKDFIKSTDACTNYSGGSTLDCFINTREPVTSISPTNSCVGKPTQFTANLDSNTTYIWYLNNATQPIQTGKGSPWNILNYTPTTAGLYIIKLRTYTTSATDYSEYITDKQVVLDSIPTIVYNNSSNHLCKGQQTILYADSSYISPTANDIWITYSPSNDKLKNATKVYMSAGLVDTPSLSWSNIVGNWGMDDGIGKMNKVGKTWQISFNPLAYFKPDKIGKLKYIAIIFRNADGSITNLDSTGTEIYIQIDTFAPVSSDKSVSAIYKRSYLWYKDGVPINGANAPHLSVNANGSYQISVTGSQCSYMSDSIQVIIDTPAVSGKISANKTIICSGQSVVLKLDSSFGNIAWQENTNGTWNYISGNSDTLTVSPANNIYYKAELTSGVCPSVSSDSIYITIDQPKIDSIHATPNGICENDSALIEVYTISANSFEWYNNSQIIANANKSSLWIKDSNIYTVQISDSIGCNVTSSPIKETIFANPTTINFIQSGHLLYIDSSKYNGMNINWYIDGKLQGTPYFSLYIDSVHSYAATITTNNGCSTSSSSKTFDFTAISSPQAKSITIFPNPSTGIYHIISDNQQPMQISITDLSGRMIQNSTLYNTEIDLSKEAAGIYILYVNVNGVRENFRLMKY